jgi:hypothetical protein
MDNEHGELALELETLPDTDTRDRLVELDRSKCHAPLTLPAPARVERG